MGKLLLTLLLFLPFPGNGSQRDASDKKIMMLKPGQVTQELGHYTTALNGNDFFLKHGEGDTRVLWIPGIDTALSTDVSALAVIDSSIIAYSGSPIYGIPGLFLFDFGEKKTRCIAPPLYFKEGFPDGTDYFEIDRVDLKNKEILFWHLKELDNVDFSTDWKSGHEYKIKFDGTGLIKVQDR
ncbi:MAG: hypothetical protein WAO19_13120 [Candidatus Kryptoniota bacterium]